MVGLPGSPKLGIGLPHVGAHASTEAIRYAASEAERVGLDSVWVLERLLRPLGTAKPMHEAYRVVYSPLETLSFVAATTTRIRLGVSVLVAAFHIPIMLARQLATLDQLSRGRLIAGIGQGYSEEEFAAARAPVDRRGDRFAEFVRVLRVGWRPDPVSFVGEFDTVPESQVGPKPMSNDGIPLIVGAMSVRSAGRAGGLGLGLNPLWIGDWTNLVEIIASHRKGASRAGVDVGRLPIVLRVNGRPFGDPAQDGKAFTGSLAHVVSDLRRARELGVTEVFYDMARTELEVDAQLSLLGEVRDACNASEPNVG